MFDQKLPHSIVFCWKRRKEKEREREEKRKREKEEREKEEREKERKKEPCCSLASLWKNTSKELENMRHILEHFNFKSGRKKLILIDKKEKIKNKK